MPRDPQEQGQPMPQNGTDTGELTDIFASLRPAPTLSTEASTAPSPVQPAAESGGFTALFSTMDVPSPGAAGVAAAPLPSEAPTQIFTALPHTPVQTNIPVAADQTVLFTPVSHVVPASPAAAPPTSPPSSSGEFTQIFQPIAPPAAAIAAPETRTPVTSATPVASAVPTPPTSTPSGEFTQFFSAISAREAAGIQPQYPAAAASSAPIIDRPAETPAPFAPAKTVAVQPGAFTQLFQQVQPPAPVLRSTLPEPAPAPPQAPDTQPGAFTQVFSQLKPPTAPAASPVPVTPPAPSSGPVFGAPVPRGSFTDLFAAQPAPSAAPGSQSAGFTELFRPAAPDLPAAPAFPPAPVASVPVSAPAAYGNVPASFAAPAVPPLVGGGGEFTRLMQSLERPGPAIPAATPAPRNAAFFDPLPAGSAGESEYTRVLRGGGAVQGGPGAAAQAHTAGSAAVPGLSLAPAAKDATVTDKPTKEKPKPLVLLLVVMNVLLLLALIVIGILVLRHK